MCSPVRWIKVARCMREHGRFKKVLEEYFRCGVLFVGEVSQQFETWVPHERALQKDVYGGFLSCIAATLLRASVHSVAGGVEEAVP